MVFRILLTTAMLATFSALIVAQGQAQDTFQGNSELWPKVRSPYAKDEAVERRVEALLGRMSLEEKVGQTIMAEIQSISPADVKRYHIGGLLNGGGSFPNKKRDGPFLAWLGAANAFYEASADESDGHVGVPVLWGTDAVHGVNNVVGATLFPHNIGLGAMRNPALMRDIGTATARELLATGIPWTFAPTVAVARNIRWGRTYESYSEDPELVAEYGKEIVLGLQGHPALDNAFAADKVIATAKHFIGDGGTQGGTDQGDTQVPEAELRDIHGLGHLTAIGAGVQTVMATFNSWNGLKTHGNPYLLTDVLKERIGFDGFVVGDWNGHGQIEGCTNADCPQAYNAGVDMIMVPEDWNGLRRSTIGHVRKGTIPMARLDDAVRRILRVKIRAGLLDRGKPSEWLLAGQEELIGHPKHRAVARMAVRQSLVLLKNNGVLPLAADQRILVAGPGANNIPMQAGGWSVTWQGDETSNADFPGATSIHAGLSQAVRAAGGEALLSVEGRFDQAPDAAIVVFGEQPYAEFEGDLGDSVAFEDSDTLNLLRRLSAQEIPTVAVFLTGRPRFVTPFIEQADSFVVAWLPGSEGQGVADVLLRASDGRVAHDFSGKLSFSWPKKPEQRPQNVGAEGYDPLYPFGFGLGYGAPPR